MKKTLYPKIIRVSNEKVVITEKLDGSNLGIFNLGGELLIAQRHYIFRLSELDKTDSYKGLKSWIEENKESLDFHEGSGVFGEWIGMGKIGYGGTEIDKRFYMFCKANINEDFELRNINYNLELLKYAFSNSKIPECIGIVPIVEFTKTFSIANLDELYITYTNKIKRPCEGFITNNGNSIKKYVRYKRGKLEDHKI